MVIAQLFQVNPLQWMYRPEEMQLGKLSDLKGKVVGVTFGGCWAAYEVARRLGPLGLVLGVKRNTGLAPRRRPVRLETREQPPVGQDG